MNATYPHAPGFKNKTEETSFRAAKSVTGSAKAIREEAMAILTWNNLTAHEVAGKIRPEGMDDVAFVRFEHSVQSRISELRAAGLVEPTKIRRKNESGQTAVVWQKTIPLTKYTQPTLI